MPEVEDSLVVHLEDPAGGNGELMLFVRAPRPASSSTTRCAPDRQRAAHSAVPRHIPDAIIAVPAVPRNRTGKKLELPVKRILQGRPIAEVASPDVAADPHALDAYVAYAAARDGGPHRTTI